MGLATMVQIIRDLHLLPNGRREELLHDAAKYLLSGKTSSRLGC
jgi:hypothetical protein